MFKRILVANRGEIACRVMRTAKRMGLETVAVYSDADARAPHVLMADVAVRLGPPPAAESYLRADLILDAAAQAGADCIHPGYGFLSERESFARACAEAGIAFIGPPPEAIAAMGDKIESKKLAKAAGVNVVPGFVGVIESTDHAMQIAAEIGYPVMMKASAGGGGKGMRLAFSEKDVRENFEAVRREGLSSFGDDRVFIEKFIESPRHIEIQVLGDKHGTILYLGERECSIQRRHQKVVEEAPSPFVTPEMRKAMGEQAVLLSKAVGYYSAGTVELIVGADRSFYFLEMNTRLQVEHPVTEYVTGLDLVEQMIRVAAGEKLPLKQKDVMLTGWSMETRIYAEDPYRGFLPSTGRLVRYRRPPIGDGVRVDDGVVEGGEVSRFYDPMIAKLITYGETREEAIDKQIVSLDRLELEGIGDNVDFLSALMQHPRFREGRLTTGFIAEEFPEGFSGAASTDDLNRRLAAIGAIVARGEAARAGQISGRLAGPPAVSDDWVVLADGVEHVVALEGETATVDGQAYVVDAPYTPGQMPIEAIIDGAPLSVKVKRVRNGLQMQTRGRRRTVRVVTPRVAELTRLMPEKIPPDLSKYLLCPMPGQLAALHVAPGDRVEAGQPLAVVEAMKMENLLRAERPATVKAVNFAVGDTLAVDAAILEFE